MFLQRGDVPVLARRGLVGTDIHRYSGRTALDQHEAQLAYEWALQEATTASGLNLDECGRQPSGDGELVVLPEGVHEPRVLAVLVTVLAARLREYNSRRADRLGVRLRVAVHHGLIHLNGATGYPGHHPVVVSRLLNSRPVRDLLRDWPTINVAAIVSADVYQDIVLNRYEALRPELFRGVRVEDPGKRFPPTDAWLYSPEEDITKQPRGDEYRRSAVR